MQIIKLQADDSFAWRQAWSGQARSHLVAVLSALAVTFVLFAVVPLILHPGMTSDVTPTIARSVTVVRLPRQEKPVRPLVQPATQAATKQVKKIPSPQPAQPQLNRSLDLPFELAPQFPDLPAVSLPLVDQVPLVASDFAVPDVFSSSDLDQPLLALVRQQPLYPLFAKQRRVQGQVRVRFVVTKNGGVEQISVIEASPAGVFEESVIRCVSGWRFRPGTVDGVAVDSWAETTISFVLK